MELERILVHAYDIGVVLLRMFSVVHLHDIG